MKITIEGPLGSGKSTAANIIRDALEKASFLVQGVDSVNGKEILLVAAEPERVQVKEFLASRTDGYRPRNAFAQARARVQAMPPAIAGKGGHHATFLVVQELVCALPVDAEAWNLLLEFNQRCEPPWSEDELRLKLKSARELLENDRKSPKSQEPLTDLELDAIRRSARAWSGEILSPLTLRLLDEHAALKSSVTKRSVVPEASEAPEERSKAYKLRAECWIDVQRLLDRVYADRVVLLSLGLSGVEITLENPSQQGGRTLRIADLTRLIDENIPDSHVMVETLRMAAEYTGERI